MSNKKFFIMVDGSIEVWCDTAEQAVEEAYSMHIDENYPARTIQVFKMTELKRYDDY